MMLSVRSYGEYSFAPFGFLYCLLSVFVKNRRHEESRSVFGPWQSYSSVGQSATLIMWRSAVQVCLGLRPWIYQFSFGGLAQLARAPALQAGGQRFESVILHNIPFIKFGSRDLWHIDTRQTVENRKKRNYNWKYERIWCCDYYVMKYNNPSSYVKKK